MTNLDHLFTENGAYVLFDGQYGSTGKGLAAAYLAHHTSDHLFGAVLTNAGPNSGHTFYVPEHTIERKGKDPEWTPEQKVVLKQLPTFSVYQRLQGRREPITALTAGAVIDPDILKRECALHGINPFVHPNAALIDDDMRRQDGHTVYTIASTGQGVGPAIQRKIGRRTVAAVSLYDFPHAKPYEPDLRHIRALYEVSQGFSLGVNQPFYPYVTSRECSAAQALSDGGVSPSYYRGGVMCIRTFPIRVGNAPNGASSGDCYPDQEETSWEALGVEPELTTVTKRVRRVFTFSWLQYRAALRANTPTVVFANFLNYFVDGEAGSYAFVESLRRVACEELGYYVAIIGGRGPRVTDCDYMGY